MVIHAWKEHGDIIFVRTGSGKHYSCSIPFNRDRNVLSGLFHAH
jgi:hypothetical protein